MSRGRLYRLLCYKVYKVSHCRMGGSCASIIQPDPEMNIRSFESQFFAAIAAFLLATSASAQVAPIALHVDASDASRQILHARLRIPAQPGQLTLLYPKWIPGEHGPTGPITDLVGLQMSAAGKTIEWRRDAEDMYAFHLEVPA